MGKFTKNQKGFTAVEGLLVVLVLAVIGFGGYYIWHSQKKTTGDTTTSTKQPATSTRSATSTQPANPYTGWRTVSFTQEGLSLKYASDWSVLSQYTPGGSALIVGQHPLNQGGLEVFLNYAPPADLGGGEAGISGNHGYTPVASFTFNNQPAYIIDDSQNDTYWLSSCAAPSLCFFSAKNNTSDGIDLHLINSTGQNGTTLPSSSDASVAEAVKIMETISY